MYMMFNKCKFVFRLGNVAQSGRRSELGRPCVKQNEFRSEELFEYKKSYWKKEKDTYW